MASTNLEKITHLMGHHHGMMTGKISMLVASSRHALRPISYSAVTATQNQSPAATDAPVESMTGEVNKTLENIKQKRFQEIANPEKLGHFNTNSSRTKADENWVLSHPIWSENELNGVKITHLPPEGTVDALALATVRGLRMMFDKLSGFNKNVRNEQIWVNRITFLETLAGVPGMVAAMTRHLHSLRRMRRDHGWIHTLIEEAENERLHLLTALQVRKPSIFFRMCVAAAQGTFLPFFSIAYLVSPHYCHRFVGYLEEEAVITYTKCLQDIENGPLSHWKKTPAPEVAIQYWNLPANATMEDVIYNIRADEAHHRIVNHTLGSMRPDDYNPYKPGE